MREILIRMDICNNIFRLTNSVIVRPLTIISCPSKISHTYPMSF